MDEKTINIPMKIDKKYCSNLCQKHIVHTNIETIHSRYTLTQTLQFKFFFVSYVFPICNINQKKVSGKLYQKCNLTTKIIGATKHIYYA